MTQPYDMDSVTLSARAHLLLNQLLDENPKLKGILSTSSTVEAAVTQIKGWMQQVLAKNPAAKDYFNGKATGREALKKLNWSDYAAVRILDYIEHEGQSFEDLNLKGAFSQSSPFKILWLGVQKGTGGGGKYFFEDMIHLFRQLNQSEGRVMPDVKTIEAWMARHPTGIDANIVAIRKKNKDRILNLIIRKIDDGELSSKKYKFDARLSAEEKKEIALKWWDDYKFHLRFAIRTPDMLNEMLGYSLAPNTMKTLYDAEKVGIPFFANPYYLSLVNTEVPNFAVGADQAIRDYVVYSKELIESYGDIVAWEKEDVVEPGKPNAAGWLLPSHDNIHRRYPEVAILIPETVGRACGGLCATCQRMYGFQHGNLNFDLDKLKPKEKWSEKLKKLLDYYENDSQLRDVLITGGDAFMSLDKSLASILESVYEMAKRKVEANKNRAEGEKYAEIVRIRLGTRLPVYLPQRVTESLCKILVDFKAKAAGIGVKQFVVQTHFESPMEITPESEKCVKMLLDAGWMVTNQHVYVAAASKRGHGAKLRKTLGDIGVLPYYTFSVKGYMENSYGFSTNARAVQEQREEKVVGKKTDDSLAHLIKTPADYADMIKMIQETRQKLNIPFLATDRNVINLPGVGKSLTFRMIGITNDGRRILEFDHDATRVHSPIINKLGKVIIIESKPIGAYLEQLVEMGEDRSEYTSLWGYTLSETEKLMPIYKYPTYDYALTDKYTNLVLPE